MSIKRFFREMLWENVVSLELRLMLPACCADIEPPVGPAISQFGINANELIDRFNDLTQSVGYDDFAVMFNIKAYRDDANVGDFFILIDSIISGSVLESISQAFYTRRRRSEAKTVIFVRDLLAFARFRFYLMLDDLSALDFPGLFPIRDLQTDFSIVLANAISLNHTIVWF